MSVPETRERLLEVALELIWQSNYSCVGVNEICRQAGVTKGAFYHHFASKAELFCEATNYYWQVVKPDLDTIFSPLNTPLEQLENIIRFLFVAKIGNDKASVSGCPFFNVGSQIGSEEKQIIDALQSLSHTAIRYNLALIHALDSGGYIVPVSDKEQLARIMYQYIHGVMSYTHIHGNKDQVKQDMPMGLYRLLGVKQQYWFKTEPTWNKD